MLSEAEGGHPRTEEEPTSQGIGERWPQVRHQELEEARDGFSPSSLWRGCGPADTLILVQSY